MTPKIKSFLKQYKYYILVPFCILLFFYVAVLIITQNENIAPFVYAIL